MDALHAVIYGIVEGLTEFLPISSTGHLLLAAELLDDNSEFQKTFSIAIQLGAILAVVVLYWRSLLVEWAVMKRVAVAFIPTGVLGLLLYKFIRSYLMNSIPTVLWSLAIGGVVIILFERFHRERPDTVQKTDQISYLQAFLIGVFQALAMIPGVSRLAATVLGGMALGVSRRTAVEFSFLLAVPTMAAATGKEVFEKGASFTSDDVMTLALGFATSFVAALFAVRWLLHFVQSHTFVSFGIYRILVAVAFTVWMLMKIDL